jgi:predicted acetyltransferase
MLAEVDLLLALASIAEASLLEIISRHASSRSTFSSIIHVRASPPVSSSS